MCFKRIGGLYLLLKVSVGEVKDLHSSISPSHSQPFVAAVKRHGSDGAGHVVEESNTVHLKHHHFTNAQIKKTKHNS